MICSGITGLCSFRIEMDLLVSLFMYVRNKSDAGGPVGRVCFDTPSLNGIMGELYSTKYTFQI